jgi:hypothetical protein
LRRSEPSPRSRGWKSGRYGQRQSSKRDPGDFSSAAFWLVGAAALTGSQIEIIDVGLNPTRTALLAVLRRFGARVDVVTTGTDAGEPRGTVTVAHEQSGSIEIGPDEVAGLIDELPAISALAASGGEVRSRRTEFRVKKRLHCDAGHGLCGLSLDAEERPDTASRFADHRPARNARRTALPTRRAITGWPWPSPSPR